MSYGMSMGFSQEQRLEQKMYLRQEISVDFPKVIEDIRKHFKEAPEGPADVRNLKELLRTIPQRQHGRLAYVIGGGWAVEVLTGKEREHGNINVLVVDPTRTTLESNRCLDYLGVQYLDNALDKALLKKDVVKGEWKRGKQNVYVPSREFMIGTKLLPRTAQEGNRDKDIEDIVQLLAVKPDVNKLTKVFKALPYIKNSESVASVVYGVSGLKSQAEGILRCLNSALREQLGAYDEKQRFSREWEEANDILGVNLSRFDFENLKRYREREAPDRNYHSWLAAKKSELVNPFGRVYYPAHPCAMPRFLDIENLNGVLDEESFDFVQKYACKHPGEQFAVSFTWDDKSGALSVWNKKGRLIYEKWSAGK